MDDSGSGEAPVRRKRRARVAINLTNCKYEVVADCAEERGWVVVTDEDGRPWNVCWTDTSVATERVMALKSFQKINHFPGMSMLCRKNGLARSLTRMHRVCGKEYAFFPESYVLPQEMSEFKAQFSGRRSPSNVWIVKPDHGCQGKGIFLTRTWETIDPTVPQVAQRYLRKPLLIDGMKFDLRVYVLVLSVDPLYIYMFEDGLVRMCTEAYHEPSEKNIQDMCMHLTNYAINKNNDKFVFNTDPKNPGSGNKRSLKWFRAWLQENGHDADALWAKMEEVAIKALISVQPSLAHIYRSCCPSENDGFACFEVLGLDILIDRKLRPWLVEVNHSPSFTCDSPLDLSIKHALISSTLELLHVGALDRKRHRVRQSANAQSRLYAGVAEPMRRVGTSTSGDSVTVTMSAVERLHSWEAKHSGGYRRIFPPTAAAIAAGRQSQDYYRKYFLVAQEVFEEGASVARRTPYARTLMPRALMVAGAVGLFRNRTFGRSEADQVQEDVVGEVSSSDEDDEVSLEDIPTGGPATSRAAGSSPPAAARGPASYVLGADEVLLPPPPPPPQPPPPPPPLMPVPVPVPVPATSSRTTHSKSVNKPVVVERRPAGLRGPATTRLGTDSSSGSLSDGKTQGHYGAASAAAGMGPHSSRRHVIQPSDARSEVRPSSAMSSSRRSTMTSGAVSATAAPRSTAAGSSPPVPRVASSALRHRPAAAGSSSKSPIAAESFSRTHASLTASQPRASMTATTGRRPSTSHPSSYYA